LDRGKFLEVEDHEVELQDGTVIPDWAWIVTPEFVNIVPVVDMARSNVKSQLLSRLRRLERR
jgi:hypothetical protein